MTINVFFFDYRSAANGELGMMTASDEIDVYHECANGECLDKTYMHTH